MMAGKKEIIVMLLVTAGLIGLLSVWTAHRNGELALLGTPEVIEDVEVPRVPADDVRAQIDERTQSDERNVASMDTQEITLSTNKGDIVIELFAGAMPITTENFLTLAREGFYDTTKFHRVISGFMIQGGDPNSKGENTSIYGQGGPGYTIEDEFIPGDLLTNTRGTIAMANTGQPDSGGSQFFINLGDNSFLDFDKEPFSSRHPVFGRVIQGMDIVDEIAGAPTAPRDIPLESIVIERVVIAE